MKKNLILFALFGLLSNVQAQEISKSLFDKQSITPTFCQMNLSKTPSCVISVGADIGTRLTASVVMQKSMVEYNDTYSPESENFVVDDSYTVNPLVSSFSNAGNKQIRVIYTSSLSGKITENEQYGRLLLTMEKDGQQVVHNLPIFFKTSETQKPNITSMILDVESIKNKKGMVNAPVLKVTNTGNGNAAFSMISFSNKNISELDIKNDFAAFNGNIMPNSTSKIILNDKRVYNYFKNNPSFVYVINKKTLLIEKIDLNK